MYATYSGVKCRVTVFNADSTYKYCIGSCWQIIGLGSLDHLKYLCLSPDPYDFQNGFISLVIL